MDNRISRQTIAENTLMILKQGFFMSPAGNKIEITKAQENAEKNTLIYLPHQTDELIRDKNVYPEIGTAEISVSRDTTLNAVRKLISEGKEDVVYLNFASAKNPGGGFLGGSQAQEESIARATGLYPCLLKAEPYYQSNRKSNSCFYTDHMIYSPNVPILKDEEGNNLDALITASVITAPAVNAGVVGQREKERVGEIETVMKIRIEKVLCIALKHHHHTIVLGAWGCGVFQNDPKDIAAYFREVIELKFKNKFRKILFAIYSSNEKFIEAFNKEFAINKPGKL